ncbi:MAG TPA: hypothetical protein VFV68_01160 [Agriterribacter sp.]|nr:hypothetical protein [Agriterribacter sp.]
MLFEFPVVADISISVSNLYGMLQRSEKVIVPSAPKTIEALSDSKKSDLDKVDWYLAKSW